MSASWQQTPIPPIPPLPPLPPMGPMGQPGSRAQVEQMKEQIRRDVQRAIEDAARQNRRESWTLRPGRPDWGGPFPPNDIIPQGAIILGMGFFVACVVTIIGLPIARAIARRMDRRNAAAPNDSADVRDRLERIEQAVDTIALEVERISEGQRYASQVMAELRAIPAPNPLANGVGVPRREKEGLER